MHFFRFFKAVVILFPAGQQGQIVVAFHITVQTDCHRIRFSQEIDCLDDYRILRICGNRGKGRACRNGDFLLYLAIQKKSDIGAVGFISKSVISTRCQRNSEILRQLLILLEPEFLKGTMISFYFPQERSYQSSIPVLFHAGSGHQQLIVVRANYPCTKSTQFKGTIFLHIDIRLKSTVGFILFSKHNKALTVISPVQYLMKFFSLFLIRHFQKISILIGLHMTHQFSGHPGICAVPGGIAKPQRFLRF